ncbi:ATP-binding cassette domain-containing protein [Burkholderia oklahomensis]|uniref:ATP-binding cassette domain-containing protein n=1 Tax=Burkholderia oklahomensis TaxID=342113 RepID=UPI0026566DD4|nr:ATP-binding cassette domain-containing protein [Burkholderia oklahomensis]MDN7676311.1 ATP-binding cassette domain-containing protein [Burkholderia oklahomensis]
MNPVPFPAAEAIQAARADCADCADCAVDLPERAASALAARRIDVKAGDFTLHATDVAFRAGALTAIVGPNGSGKSTLLEALFGFRRARLEGATILGVPAARFMRDTRELRRFGAQLQRVEYAEHARVDEILAVHRALYRKQDTAVAQALAIDELRAKPYSGLSKGQRQRLDLFIAFAHRPALVALDEPFTGLDRTMTRSVLDLLRGPLAGITVVMICHAGEELEIADDVLWVRDGALRYQGGKDALKRRLVGEFRALIHVDGDAQAQRVRAVLAQDAHVQRIVAPAPLQIGAFGRAGLDRTLRTLMETAGIRHFEFAPTDEGDLLRACTEGATDA